MSKTTKIISLVLKIIVSGMLTMSAVMKLSHAQPIVEAFSKSNLINLITLIGLIELGSLVLFWVPKTGKLGFLLLTSYLGGALSIELAGAQTPMAAILLAVLWTSVYLKNKEVFLPLTEKKI